MSLDGCFRAAAATAFWVGTLGGCASTQPATPPAAAVATNNATPAMAAPAAANFVLPATHVEGAPGVLRLCDALQASDGMTFKGNAVEQAHQRQAHDERRASSLDSRYELTLPAAGFRFDGYDDGKLKLVDTRFSVEDGIELDRAADEPIAFELSDAAAERLLQMHAEGKLKLRLVFSPQPSQMRPDVCLRQSGGRMVKFGAQVLAAYVVGPLGAPLARFETEAFAQEMAAVTPVHSAAVYFGKPVSADATPVSPSLQEAFTKLEPSLVACYREALTRKATTQGTLIVGLTLSKDGRAQQPRMEMSTITDEALVACAVASIGKASVPATPPLPAALSLPLTFGEAR
ncbi:MAG: hypothetical protein SF187_04765 [Deltaproteobacteria bacterium]|nr:hypothetical protein [Deltaproteobacteria bacterium]